eukprot:14869941-Alexandrium_andersonii.AAC.1
MCIRDRDTEEKKSAAQAKEQRGLVPVDDLPPVSFDEASGEVLVNAASRARDAGVRAGTRVRASRAARQTPKGALGT